MEIQGDGAGDFHVVLKGRGGIDQDVGTGFEVPLIARARRQMDGIATQRAADGGHRIGGVVHVAIGYFGARGSGGERAVAYIN